MKERTQKSQKGEENITKEVNGCVLFEKKETICR